MFIKKYESLILTFETPYLFQQSNEQHVAHSFTKLAVPHILIGAIPMCSRYNILRVISVKTQLIY
jgi:hypothetical protein